MWGFSAGILAGGDATQRQRGAAKGILRNRGEFPGFPTHFCEVLRITTQGRVMISTMTIPGNTTEDGR